MDPGPAHIPTAVREEHSWGTNGTEPLRGPTQLPGLSARTRTWLFLGLCPSHGTGVWPPVDLPLQSPDTMLGGWGAGSSQPGSWAPHAPTSSADQGRGTGPRGRGRRWALSLLIYDKDVRGSYAACGSALCASQETLADKWGQAAGRPSENCWACGLVKRDGAKPQRPLSGSAAHSRPTGGGWPKCSPPDLGLAAGSADWGRAGGSRRGLARPSQGKEWARGICGRGPGGSNGLGIP